MNNALARAIRIATGAQANWRGCEPVVARRVYFANHASNLDFLVIWSVLPDDARAQTRPVAAADYWKNGKLRRYFAEKVFRGVLIERAKVTKSNNPLTQMIPVLQGGESLIIFPEGGRTTDGVMRPFKSGLYYIAKAVPEVDLVPVYIDNASRILPKGDFLPVPIICSLTFGAPMRVGEGEAKDVFLTRARAAVEALAT